MERLTRTELGPNGEAVCNYQKEDCNDSCMYGMCKWNKKALLKLWEYENAQNGYEYNYLITINQLSVENLRLQREVEHYKKLSSRVENKELMECAKYWQSLYEKEHKIVENMREYVKEQIDE